MKLISNLDMAGLTSLMLLIVVITVLGLLITGMHLTSRDLSRPKDEENR